MNSTLDNKLTIISDKINSLTLTSLENKSKIKSITESLKTIKDDFTNLFNSVLQDLTLIIENVNSLQDQTEGEESPASIIANKIINLNKSETYLLDNETCNKILEWLEHEANFELIFRASTDGFSSDEFHSRCDKKGPTLVVCRSNYDKVFGGYSPCEWDGTVTYDYTYVHDLTKTSFLFSLTSGEKYPIKDTNNAISNSAHHGPKYGGGHDIEIVSNCNVNYTTYNGIGNTYNFSGSKSDFYGAENSYYITEYEVYRVL